MFGLSGGLVGPEGTPFDVDGSMEGTPVFLGCSDRDPHIPLERIYEGMGHTVNRDEIAFVRDTMTALVARHAAD